MMLELALGSMMACGLSGQEIKGWDTEYSEAKRICYYSCPDSTKDQHSTLKQYSCPQTLNVDRPPLPFKDQKKRSKWTKEYKN